MVTKAMLINDLVKQGRGTHTALQRLTKAGLEAMLAEEPTTPVDRRSARPQKVKAETLAVGQIVHGSGKRDPLRKVARISVGRKWVTVWDEADKCFGYWPRGTKVEVLAP